MTAKQLLLDRFDVLSPKLQAAARFVIDHPNEVVIHSMRTLAEHAGLQPATLVRLAQQVGWAGWPALKTAFAHDLGLSAEGYGQRAKTLTGRAQDLALVGEMFGAQRANLAATEAQSAVALRSAAKALQRAKVVHVAGFRASLPIAFALVYGYRLFRDSVHLIDGQAGGLEMQLRPIARGDAVAVASFAPYSREALVVLQAARAARARVIAFTDSAASPLALQADVSVLFAVESPSFFPSVVAGVAAVEALLEILVADAGDAITRAIDRAERQLFDSGAYLQPPTRQAARR